MEPQNATGDDRTGKQRHVQTIHTIIIAIAGDELVYVTLQLSH